MDEMKTPMLGDRFPEMNVMTTDGVKHLPDDYKNRWLVLFSHPGDFTPVCTTEFIEFSERAGEFDKLNCSLMGLSVDQVFSHMKWTEWIEKHAKVKVPFPIIGDELGRTAQRLGMLHPNKGTNTVRAVYIIDPEGVIRLMLFYPQEAGRNVDEILRVLEALQTSDKFKVAMPEKWPNNRHSKNKVILPPPPTNKLAAERLAQAEKGECECLDWWLCYKSL